MTVHARVFRNSYRDSVELMRIAAEIEGLEGITRAGLVMATPAILPCKAFTMLGWRVSISSAPLTCWAA